MSHLRRTRARGIVFCVLLSIWPSWASAQLIPGCPVGFQTITVSGQASIPIVEALLPAVQLGTAMICFNPQESCYVAMSQGNVTETLPFSARQGNGSLTIDSMARCGGQSSSRTKPFHFVASSGAGNNCLDSLSINNNGATSSGQLLGDGSVSIITDSGPPAVLMDVPYLPNSATPQNVQLGPAFHHGLALSALVPTLANGSITVVNQNSGQPVGTVNRFCGIHIGSSGPTSIPALSRWGLVLLCAVMLLATVWITRRQTAA